MNNLKLSILLALITIQSRYLELNTVPEIVAGMIALTIIWWAALVGLDRLKEKWTS